MANFIMNKFAFIGAAFSLNRRNLRCPLRRRGVQHSAKIDNEVDKRANQCFATDHLLNAFHRCPLTVNLFYDYQPMGARPTVGFGRKQVVFTMCPFDKESLSSHRDYLFAS